jgi:hypothetical protein
MRTFIACALLAASAHGAAITRYFSGTINSASGSSAIPIGTTFTGYFTYDDAVAHCGCADSQHRDYFLATGTPPGEWRIVVGSGLYDILATNVGLEVHNNFSQGGTHDGAFFWANAATVTGSGSDTVITDTTNTLIQWNRAGTTPITTADSLVGLATVLDPINWVGGTAGITITTSGSNVGVFTGQFTTFSDTAPVSETPEPSSMLLGAAGLAAATLLGRRSGARCPR